MNEQQNSTDPLREEFETAISELTPDERAELLEQAGWTFVSFISKDGCIWLSPS